MEDYEFDFLNYMRDKRKASTNTLNAYKIDISKFSEYIKDNCGLSLADVNKTTILNYLMDLQSNGRSPATISRTLASIRSFYKYLTNYGYITNDPAYELRSFKSIRKSPQGLSRFQIEILLSMPELKKIKGYRDKAMLEVMYATGMRVSDLINLKLSDVNLEVGYILSHSGTKEHIIPIYALARDSVKAYLDKRKEIPNSDKSEILFLNLSGQPLSRQGVWKMIKYYHKKSGIGVDITPNSLRNSFAIHMLEGGADIKTVQDMLGHTEIASTKAYEQALNDKMSDEYIKCHPRAKYYR